MGCLDVGVWWGKEPCQLLLLRTSTGKSCPGVTVRGERERERERASLHLGPMLSSYFIQSPSARVSGVLNRLGQHFRDYYSVGDTVIVSTIPGVL